jgi:hypothetical protein
MIAITPVTLNYPTIPNFYSPTIFWENGIYKMWTTIADSVRYFTSYDGKTWTDGEMVFSADPNSWENDGGTFGGYTTGISDPRVVRGATSGWAYTMYYTAGPAPNNSVTGGIGAVVSQDGISWTHLSNAPLRSAPGGFTFVVQAIEIRGIRYVYYLSGGSAAQVIPPTLHVMQDVGDGLHFINDHEITGLLARVYPLAYDAATDTCLMVDNISSPGSFTLYANSDGFTTLGQPITVVSPVTTGNPMNFDPMVVERNSNGQWLGADGNVELIWTTGDSHGWQPTAGTIYLPSLVANQAPILFQNASGQLANWAVHNLSILTSAVLAPNPGPNAFAMASAQFYANGTPDILFQDSSGNVSVWQMSGTNVVGSGPVANPGVSWHVVGTGDFYNDGDASVLWQNDNGSVAIWDMQGASIVKGQILAANPGPTWHVRTTGNFYHDGNADIVFQNDSGWVMLWDMHLGARINAEIVQANPGPTWRIKGAGDFYGDGNTDILWQNDNGSVAIWDMNGATIVKGAVVAANPGSGWHVKAVSDFDHDGKSDIAWESDDGSVAVWQMNGTRIASGAILAAPGASWTVVGSDQHMRFLYSTGPNDTLLGSSITPDEFVLTHCSNGAHTVANFNPVQDVIELSSSVFRNFDAVVAATTETSAGSLIHVGSSSTILMSGVDIWDLRASNIALG